MKFEFEIHLHDGLDPGADDLEDILYEAGFDDSTVAVMNGKVCLFMEREGDTLEAILQPISAALEGLGVTETTVYYLKAADFISFDFRVTNAGEGDTTFTQ